MKHSLRKEVCIRLAHLTPLEQKVMCDIFGIGEHLAKPLPEIAGELGVQEDVVADELTGILRKLRNPSPDETPDRRNLPTALLRRILRCSEAIALQTANFHFPPFSKTGS